MKTILLAASVISLAAAAGCAEMERAERHATRYEVVAKFPVGGAGGWDFISIDAKRHRLYVSRGDHVQVVDSRSGNVVGDLPGTAGVHGVAIADSAGFTSNGRSDSVTVFDLDTLAIVETVKVTGGNPDAILYDVFSKRVFAFNGRTANVTAIDAVTRKVVGTIALSGKPEVAVADGRGQVFVNIEDKNSIAVIDTATLAVSRYLPLGSCEEPTGLAIDPRRGRLFSVCHNKKMVIVDARSGSVVKELPIGADVDGAEFDAGLDLAFSSNGEGTVTVVKSHGAGQYSVVETVATQKSARTIALDSTTHRIFLPAASFGPPPAPTAEQPRPRAPMIPESFVIVVLAPRSQL